MADNNKSVIIHLPDDAIARSAGYGKENLEDLVKSMFSGQVGRGLDNVIIRSGAGAASSAARDWMKTIWKRAC